MMKYRLEVKESVYDKRIPSDCKLWYRFYTFSLSGKQRRIQVLFETNNEDIARQELPRFQERLDVEFCTIWKDANGRQVRKLARILRNTKRFFRVTIPYQEELSDQRLIDIIRNSVKDEIASILDRDVDVIVKPMKED